MENDKRWIRQIKKMVVKLRQQSCFEVLQQNVSHVLFKHCSKYDGIDWNSNPVYYWNTHFWNETDVQLHHLDLEPFMASPHSI